MDIVFVTLFELFVLQVVLTRGKRNDELSLAISTLNYMAFGFVLSFFLHFAVYTKFSLGWQYLLLDFKMIFPRDTVMFSLNYLGTYVREFVLYVKYAGNVHGAVRGEYNCRNTIL
jgi:hypothetical protein